MKKYYIYILLLLLAACTEPYDIELGSAEQQLVVEGSVTTDSIFQQVKLTGTVDYFESSEYPGINEASVFISFNSDTVLYHYVEGTNGVYQSEIAFSGQPYTRYTLHVDSVLLKDDNQYHSYTATDSMSSIIPIDSISAVYDDPIEAWWVRIFTYEPGETDDWYIFKVGINDKLVSDTISEWQITDDMLLNGNYLHGVDVQYLQDEYDDERPSVGDTIWLELEHVSEEYNGFCMNIQVESGYRMPLFSGQPANVPSNVLPDGLGFFSAIAKSKQYTIVKELPYDGYDEE